ncbi:MAG: hypothetical protein ACPGF8_05425 [Opitutales bacterium]
MSDIIKPPKHCHCGASFSYDDMKIEIGVKDPNEGHIFMLVCHELWEIVACESNVRLRRPDCDTDYIFVYDHRQHETMSNMFASLIAEFIQ